MDPHATPSPRTHAHIADPDKYRALRARLAAHAARCTIAHCAAPDPRSTVRACALAPRHPGAHLYADPTK